jgi:hypothetical protein
VDGGGRLGPPVPGAGGEEVGSALALRVWRPLVEEDGDGRPRHGRLGLRRVDGQHLLHRRRNASQTNVL